MQSFEDIDITQSRILIFDGQDSNIHQIGFFLDSARLRNRAYATDPLKVLDVFAKFRPDLLLLCLRAPYDDGFEVMEKLKVVLGANSYLPVVIMSADISAEAKRRALFLGADDFLSEPLDALEAVPRIKNLLQAHWLFTALRTHNETLDRRVRERTADLAEAHLEVVERLATASEYRDDDTGQHAQRVGRLAAMIARSIGQSEQEVEMLRIAATLHDVGKIGVPDRVLMKEGKLTPEEFTIVKSHTNIGGEILRQSRFPLLQMAREIALSHHERWDGTGYPQGLKAERIPLSGRIVAIADVFDALTHDRPYKKGWSLDETLHEMKQSSERQFDPELLKAFFRAIRGQSLQSLIKSLEGENAAIVPAILRPALVSG